jgi:hypothetical protein
MFDGRGLSEKTLKLYKGNLKRLNGGVEPTSPAFLKNTEKIKKKLEEYSPNTRKTNYITIVSYLKDQKVPKKLLKHYTDLMDDANKNFEEHKSEKTKTQIENWISWEQVLEHYKALPSSSLERLVLSLFVLQPPRRSKDYFLMRVVPQYNDNMDKNFNYYDAKENKMYFNNYKTKNAYGTQTIDVPKELVSVIQSFYPMKGNFEPFFLLQKNGKSLPENGITRILNKIFGKNISVSMLRTIYLTDTFGDEQKKMNETSKSMGTSAEMLSHVYTKSK